MKKHLYLLFLFMAFVAFAQPKIHSITTFNVSKENQKTVQLFDYQDNDLTIKEQTWQYKRLDSTPRLIADRVQRFTTNKQLLSEERHSFESIRYHYASRIDNKFDTKGCQTEKRVAILDTNGKENRAFLTLKETNTACLLTKEMLKRYNIYKEQLVLDSFDVVKTFEYDNRDSLKKIVYDYFYKSLISNSIPQGVVQYMRRTDGKVTEVYEDNNCEFCIDLLGNPIRRTFDYNALGQVIVEKKFVSYRKPLQLEDSTVFTYLPSGELSRKTRFNFDDNDRLSSKSTFDYDYYCDNLLKSETTLSEYQNYPEGNGVLKTIYTYTEGTNCDKKDLQNFTISPNPTSFYALIESEALLSADYTLTVYSLSGETIQTYPIYFRTTKFDFSSANLLSGSYLVRLTNGKNSLTKKLVVTHQ